MKEKLRALVRDRFFFFAFLLLFIGALFKNLLLRAYILSGNPFVPDFSRALGDFIRALPINIALLCALFSFALLMRGNGRYVIIAIVNVLITAAAFIDTMYFRSFNSLPSLTLISLVSHIGNTKSDPLSWVSVFDLLYFADLIAFAVALIIRAAKKLPKIKLPALPKRFALVFSLCVCVILTIPFLSLFGVGTNAYEEIYDAPYVSDTALYFTPLGYHVCDLAKIVFDNDESSDVLSEEEIAQIERYYSFAHSNTESDDLRKGAINDKNLIVIQVESLESFVIGKSIGGEEITPFINSILDRSVFFDRVYEQVRGGNSSDCDFMFATSILPEASGSIINDHPDNTFTTLAKVLGERGYYSAYFNEDSVYWDYDKAMLSLFGYDDFYDVSEGDDLINGYLSDGARFNNVLDVMKKNEKFGGKFYAHVVTCTSHTPFNPSALPDEYNLDLPEDIAGSEIGGYLRLVRYTDAMIGKFLSDLDSAGMLEGSAVVIYGDHCGIHKYFPDDCASLAEDGADMFAFDEWGEATVPFIVYDPSGELEAMKSDKIAGQIDLSPTLLYLFGYENESFDSQRMGRSLFDKADGFAVLPSGVIVGDIDPESDEYEIIYRSYDTADIMIQSDYFSSARTKASNAKREAR